LGITSSQPQEYDFSVLPYPSWVKEHLTPHLESPIVRDPGPVTTWLDFRQSGLKFPDGHSIYTAVKRIGKLEISLSFGDLKFLEANPDKIPKDWLKKKLIVHAWASVVLRADGSRCVPGLVCCAGLPYVDWYHLDGGVHAFEPARVRAS